MEAFLEMEVAAELKAYLGALHPSLLPPPQPRGTSFQTGPDAAAYNSWLRHPEFCATVHRVIENASLGDPQSKRMRRLAFAVAWIEWSERHHYGSYELQVLVADAQLGDATQESAAALALYLHTKKMPQLPPGAPVPPLYARVLSALLHKTPLLVARAGTEAAAPAVKVPELRYHSFKEDVPYTPGACAYFGLPEPARRW